MIAGNVNYMTNEEETGKRKGKKRYILILAAILVLILILLWAEPKKVYETFLIADPKFITIAIMIQIVTSLLLLARWHVLYRPEAEELYFFDCCKIYLIGQITNQIAPMGSGEIARGLVGSRYYDVHFSKTLVAAVIERVEDILFFLFVAVIGLILFFHNKRFYIELAVFIFFAGLALTFFLKPHAMDGLMKRLEGFFKKRGNFFKKLSTKLISSWETFKESMFAYHERKFTMTLTILITIAVWFTDALAQFMIFRAFGIEINYFYVLAIASVSFVVGALSFLPGGLGAREGTFAYLTTFFNYSKATGLGIALVYKAIVYMIFSIGAIISIVTLPSRLQKKKDSEGEDKDNSR